MQILTSAIAFLQTKAISDLAPSAVYPPWNKFQGLLAQVHLSGLKMFF